MQEIKDLLTKGREQINDKKYTEAEMTLNDGLSKIEATQIAQPESFEVYSGILSQLSYLYFTQKDYDKSEEYIQKLIDFCNTKRENNNFGDALNKTLSIAYYRLGEIKENKGLLLPCLQEYVRSAAIIPNNEGQQAFARILTELGLPPISDAPEMAPFLKISKSLLQEEELVKALSESLKFMKNPDFDVNSFSTAGGCRIYFVVIQIYMNNPVILGISIQCLTFLAQNGSQDVFAGYPLIKLVLDVAVVNNAPLFGFVIQLIQYTPPPLFQYMDKLDFLDPLCDGLTLDLSEDEMQMVMYLLFHLTNSDDQISKLVTENVTEVCLKHRSDGSFMLLSKLCFNHKACMLSIKDKLLDWASGVLVDPKSENHLTLAAFYICTQLFEELHKMLTTDPIEQDDSNAIAEVCPSLGELPALVQKIEANAMKSLLANTKNPEIIYNAFNFLTFCLPYAKEQLIQQKAIQAASVMLSVQNDNIKVAATILEFLYKACEVLGADEVKKVKPVLPTAMKALNTHTTNPLVVEYGAALAVYLDHPKKESLLDAALEVFPKSELLLQMKQKL